MGAKLSTFKNNIRKRMKQKNNRELEEKMEEMVWRGFFQTPSATENEVMKQLQNEGLIPTITRHGGVAFDVPFEGNKPRCKAPRRLAQLGSPRKSVWTREEKRLLAGIYKEEYLDNLRKVARREEEKRRRAAERKIEQQILLQKSRSEKFFRKMAAAENRRKERNLLRKKVLPPIKKEDM